MGIARTLAILAVAAAGSAAIPSAVAQNVNAEPNYGTINLRSGFLPDPRIIALQSGGDIDVSRLNNNCRGYITNAPDVRLNYTAGSLPLYISVDSSADTTLVINGPDGEWYCDDDGGTRGLNPSIRFETPQSGRYEIWVGTYGGPQLRNARLHISELYSQ
jgi:hypothetical protein